MPLVVLSPYSGNPVKVRDQDVSRAIRDEEGRIFYVVQRADGKGFYASMTRNGSARDEERYAELEAKTARQREVTQETVLAIHDATGKRGGRSRGLGRVLLTLLLLALLAALAYGAFVLFGDQLLPGNSPVPSLPAPSVPSLPPPQPGAAISGAAFKLGKLPTGDEVRRPPQTDIGALLEAGSAPPLLVPESDAEPASAAPASAQVPTLIPRPESPMVMTPSGVAYRILQRGNGGAAQAGSYVLIHYDTLMPDGTVLDSTRDSTGAGEPIGFVLWAGQVIKGWDLGVAGMQVGEKRRLVVPGELVKGAADVGAEAPPPGMTLTFDIELVDILPGVLSETVREGNVGGEVAMPGDTVEIDYVAMLDTATQPFDTSTSRGYPLRFRLGTGAVIQGLDLGVGGMKVGEKRVLVIPPHLAYGRRGIAGLIPPDASLRYEVELVGVNR